MYDFSVRLREETKREHSLSTSIVHITAPLALSSPRVYRILLASFYHIFASLESLLESNRKLHPKISGVYFRQILRTEAFEKDMRYYYSLDVKSTSWPLPSEATQKYIETMTAEIEKDPVLLIAYTQTMYMAVFAGGNILRKWIGKAFGYGDGVGVAAFDFSATVTDTKAFVKSYDGALNRIALTEEEKERIIACKKRIFDMNDTIFQELRTTKTYIMRVLFLLAQFCGGLVLIWLLLLVVKYIQRELFYRLD